MDSQALVWEPGKVKVGYPWAGGGRCGVHVITASPGKADAVTAGEQPLPGDFKDRVLEILDHARAALGDSSGAWIRFPVRQQSGDSFGLALALADHLQRHALDTPLARRAIIATGCVRADGRVAAVDHFPEKLDYLAREAPPGSLVLIPEENHEALRADAGYLAVREALERRGVEVWRVGSVAEIRGPEKTPSPTLPLTQGGESKKSPPRMRGRFRGGLILLGLLLALLAYALFPVSDTPPAPDHPACRLLHPAPGETLLGLPWPARDAAFDRQAAALALFYEDTRVCRVAWREILPRLAPWDGDPALPTRLYAWGIFAAAGLLCLLMVPLLPRAWRRHLTLLGIIGWLGASWTLGVAGLAVAHGLGLPQRHLLDEVVVLDGERWLSAASIAELDRQLLAAGLEPREIAPAVALRPIRDSLAVFRDTLGDLELADLMATRFVPTGAQQVRDGERLIEVRAGEDGTAVWLPARALAVETEE